MPTASQPTAELNPATPAGRVVVCGAGIAGLATAIAVREAGWAVTVLERSAELRPLGAGLSIWPNGVRALRALGLGGVVAERGTPSGGALRRADGSILADFDPGEIEARFGAPLVGLHRADLHDALVGRLGEDTVRLGAAVRSVAPGEVALEGGERVSADLIVGADGSRSAVRAALLGDGPPQPAGIVAYRATVAATGAELPAGEWWGRGTVAGVLPLSADRVYWYLAHRGSGRDPEELTRRARQFAAPIPELVAAAPEQEILCHELVDRPPVDRWGTPWATLAGDAAHPMLPFLGQGACAALEDAVALGAALGRSSDPAEAVAAYEAERASRTAGLVRGSRAAARLALASGRVTAPLRDALTRSVPHSLRMRRLEQVIGS